MEQSLTTLALKYKISVDQVTLLFESYSEATIDYASATVFAPEWVFEAVRFDLLTLL